MKKKTTKTAKTERPGRGITKQVADVLGVPAASLTASTIPPAFSMLWKRATIPQREVIWLGAIVSVKAREIIKAYERDNL